MRKIETAEQARVWLATYEAEVGRRGGASAMEEADKAVEAWRSRVGAVEKPPAEDADMRTKRDAARALLDDVRMALKTHNVADEGLPAVVTGIMAAKEALRTEVADLRSKLAVVNDLHDKAVAAQDRLLSERSRLQKEFAAMKERLAEAEKQLAGVRIILEASGVPARGTLEERLRAGLVELTDALRKRLAALGNHYHVALSHECSLSACNISTCQDVREALGAEWFNAWWEGRA